MNQGVLLAPVTVPSQRSGVSCPLNIAAGDCTRCGRPTEPGNIWNICSSCDPGAAVAVGPSQASVKRHPTANCAACRVALRIPSRYQAVHVLCPPCHAQLHAAITDPKPQDRAVPRANAYPVVTPVTTSTQAMASTVAYTYPHLPPPSPPDSLLQSVGAVVGAHTTLNHAKDVAQVCMRFGCGAQLPAHVLGDACEACAGAGFVRPPRTVIQERIYRHATDPTCSRSRESRDLVCTSLIREAAPSHGATMTTEWEDAENEMELDLVYPDDVPVVTQCTLTTAESKREESKPVDDEDVELELVYPEDAGKATETSSGLRTKVSPPTTLRKLFTGGLQTIPTLQDLTVRVAKIPPRRCRVPGCNETLPAHTCMERCVKCSIGDWKRRKLASTDIDSSRRPSTSSLWTTSVEEKEVTTMLDEMSDVEDKSDLSSPSSSQSKNSSDGLMADHGVRSIPGWDSDLTELSELSSLGSDSESVSDSDSDSDPRIAGPRGDTSRLTIRIPLLVNRLPPDSLLRKCGNKKCNIALPKDHRWKTCDPCRRAQRTYQRVRLENKRRSVLGIEMLTSANLHCRRWRSLSPDMYEADATLTPESSRPCSAKHCRSRIPLSEVYQWKTCTGCRARTRRKARRKRDALFETRHASRQPEIVPRFPAYQNRGALLSSFDARLKGFAEGQIMFLRAKLHDSRAQGQRGSEPWEPGHAPMTFTFVGEYSIVTGSRGDSERNDHGHDCDDSRSPDGPAGLEAMRQEVSSIVSDLGCALRAKFRPGEAFAIEKGGMIMRFTCSLELIAQLHPLATTVGPDSGPSSVSDSYPNAPRDEDREEDVSLTLKPPPNTPAVPLVKTLSGELEAVILPDESHRLFHGRRTVIRYCMLG